MIEHDASKPVIDSLSPVLIWIENAPLFVKLDFSFVQVIMRTVSVYAVFCKKMLYKKPTVACPDSLECAVLGFVGLRQWISS